MKTLAEMPPGEIAVIDNINLDDLTRDYLAAVGIGEEARIRFVKTAPLGSPMEFFGSGGRICLRKKEAANITIKEGEKMNIALIGRPNCGKSLLFNVLTHGRQHVGNWPKVTVEKRAGRLAGHDDIYIQDLPGIYSLAPDSPDGRITIDYLQNEKPDRMLNIVDATNLSAGLYLTLQLRELDIPMVIALNMMDLAAKDGIEIDHSGLAEALACPVIPISAYKKSGLDELIAVFMTGVEGYAAHSASSPAEKAALVQELCGKYVHAGNEKHKRKSEKIDAVLTHRIWGLPIFAAIMYFIYAISITGLGKMGTMFIKKQLFGITIAEVVRNWLVELAVSDWLISLVVDGIIAGVGSVLRYAPRLFLLFLFISILEDSGYMARAAFLLDRLFSRVGLSGRSFIPMFVSTGCAVPGIMASKTIPNQGDRRIAIP